MGRLPLGAKLSLIFMMGFFLFLAGNSIVGYWNPSAEVRMNDRVGKDGSHIGEKFATGLLGNAIGIAGAWLGLRRRVALGFGLIGTCYTLEAVRREVFYVWEGGRLFDQGNLGPWIFLILGLPMFWIAYRDHRKREEALAALEEVH